MSEDSEDFEREERAFAEALRASVPVETFRPLDAEAIKAAARPARSGPTRWLKGMAAAAVLVVAVGIGAALLPRVAGSQTAEPASGGYAAGGVAPETAQDRASGAAAPGEVTSKVTSDAGFRWESYRDVMVQVPDAWGYASAPQSDYCIGKRFPTEPYVDLTRGPVQPVRSCARAVSPTTGRPCTSRSPRSRGRHPLRRPPRCGSSTPQSSVGRGSRSPREPGSRSLRTGSLRR